MTYITESSIPGLAQSHHGRFQEISVCLARSMRPPWWRLFGLQQKKSGIHQQRLDISVLSKDICTCIYSIYTYIYIYIVIYVHNLYAPGLKVEV